MKRASVRIRSFERNLNLPIRRIIRASRVILESTVSFARYLYSKGTNIYIYTLHTRKKVIGINNLARIIESTHIRVDGWSGEFYIESRGTKSERTKGEYRDAEKGKHFIRFCEIIERERGVCKRRDAKEAATVSEVHEVKNAALHDKREATGGGERER